jgi:hypothetical protein
MSDLAHVAATHDEPRRDLTFDERAWIASLDDAELRRLALSLHAVEQAARNRRVAASSPLVWRRPS